MKIKEMLDTYTFEDIVKAIADMDICLFHDDYVKLTEVYDVMKASKSTKNKYLPKPCLDGLDSILVKLILSC